MSHGTAQSGDWSQYRICTVIQVDRINQQSSINSVTPYLVHQVVLGIPTNAGQWTGLSDLVSQLCRRTRKDLLVCLHCWKPLNACPPPPLLPWPSLLSLARRKRRSMNIRFRRTLHNTKANMYDRSKDIAFSLCVMVLIIIDKSTQTCLPTEKQWKPPETAQTKLTAQLSTDRLKWMEMMWRTLFGVEALIGQFCLRYLSLCITRRGKRWT